MKLKVGDWVRVAIWNELAKETIDTIVVKTNSNTHCTVAWERGWESIYVDNLPVWEVVHCLKRMKKMGSASGFVVKKLCPNNISPELKMKHSKIITILHARTKQK